MLQEEDCGTGATKQMDISKIQGMVFTSPANGEPYGTIRDLQGEVTADFFTDNPWTPFAEDDCGNFFAVSAGGTIGFWDHELDEITTLADSFDDFARHCSEPEEVELSEDQVQSAWIDPAFAKQMGIDAPDDGWIKKETGPDN